MENSKIEWTQHTFSPWHGCAKVSPGCKNCYADAQHNFHYSSLKAQQGTCWGVSAPRLAVSEDTWKKPLRWNRDAAAAGIRARVFCASMADVFEPQSALSAAFAGQTAEVPKGKGTTRTVRFVDVATERLRLLRLIFDTPHLDWLLLTKRPENIGPALEAAWRSTTLGPDLTETYDLRVWLGAWLEGTPPANVWLGTSVENQEQADIRVPQLLAAPAVVRFLSCEPLLGKLDLGRYLCGCRTCLPLGTSVDAAGFPARIEWVIVGGESGPRARPMHPEWVRAIQKQCAEYCTAFFFKQWGNWAQCWDDEWHGLGLDGKPQQVALSLTGQTSGGFLGEAHAAQKEAEGWLPMQRLDKHAAGRKIDGRTWDELPIKTEVTP